MPHFAWSRLFPILRNPKPRKWLLSVGTRKHCNALDSIAVRGHAKGSR